MRCADDEPAQFPPFGAEGRAEGATAQGLNMSNTKTYWDSSFLATCLACQMAGRCRKTAAGEKQAGSESSSRPLILPFDAFDAFDASDAFHAFDASDAMPLMMPPMPLMPLPSGADLCRAPPPPVWALHLFDGAFRKPLAPEPRLCCSRDRMARFLDRSGPCSEVTGGRRLAGMGANTLMTCRVSA